MANPSDTLLNASELREQLTSGLDSLSSAEASEVFSERLEEFLEQNDIDESDIISGQTAHAPVLSEAAFNGLDFSGLEGTGLSLPDAYHMMNDKAHRLEMAETYLTGNEEKRIEREYSDPVYEPYSIPGTADIMMGGTLAFEAKIPTSYELTSSEGLKALDEAVKTKEFMHYELRDALNSGEDGSAATLEDFDNRLDRDEWMQMKGDQAAFHQNGGAEDLKFIHPDGREAVYDGDTNALMTEDRYMGTYNYENATIPADSTPGPIEAYRNTQTEGSQLHKAYDVDPWIELGNTRADRYANGGEAARQEQMSTAIREGIGNSIGNTVDETSENISDAKDAVREKFNQAGEAINDAFEGIQGGLWQEGALSPAHQHVDGAHIQYASLSETTMPTGAGTIHLEDAITMLAEDQKTLNASSTGEQPSTVQDALNHPDALQMFQNLQTHGVKTLSTEITPDMSLEDRVSELLLSGQKATEDAGIPMPSGQRELEATQELNNSYDNNSYEDDYSISI